MDRKSCSNHKRRPIANVNSDKSVNNNAIISSSMTRKPLSDLTNFNLTPTHTLRKLCSNSINTSQARTLLRKSQAPIFPIHQNPPNSGPSKPYIVSDSDTSIGSSNFNPAPNTQPQKPTPIPRSSLSNNPNPTGEKGSKTVIYSRRRNVENPKRQRKTDILPTTKTVIEKAKNQERAIPASLSSAYFEKARDKGKAIAGTLDSTPIGKLGDKGKEISVHLRSSNVQNAWDKGKAIYASRTSTLVEETKDKGKAVAYEDLEDIGKSTPVHTNNRPSKKLKEKRKADAMFLSCPPLLRTRNTGNDLDQVGEIKSSKSWTDPHPKTKKKKCSRQQSASEYSLPEEYVQQQKAYFEEVDAFELPVEEVSDNDFD